MRLHRQRYAHCNSRMWQTLYCERSFLLRRRSPLPPSRCKHAAVLRVASKATLGCQAPVLKSPPTNDWWRAKPGHTTRLRRFPQTGRSGATESDSDLCRLPIEHDSVLRSLKSIRSTLISRYRCDSGKRRYARQQPLSICFGGHGTEP